MSAEDERGELSELPVDRLRKVVREDLVAHRTSDTREAAARQRIIELIDQLRDPFGEHAQPEHITGSAVVVGQRGTVLHLHKRLGRWLQPGGHLEAGEAPWDAAIRETREETGLEVWHPRGSPLLVHVDVHPAADGHTHLDLRFLLSASDEAPRPGPGESQKVRWFSWEEAETVADPALIGALRAVRRELREPSRDARDVFLL